jgi:predicted nucleic-acid-binding protein
VRLTADTNVLVRAIMSDEAKQARLAQTALAKAELIAVPTAALCEFVWVLARGYGIAHAEIAAAVRTLIASANVAADRPAVEAGLAVLDDGGDFADGVIAFEGAGLGGDTFASFDKDAVKRLKKQGLAASLLE